MKNPKRPRTPVQAFVKCVNDAFANELGDNPTQKKMGIRLGNGKGRIK